MTALFVATRTGPGALTERVERTAGAFAAQGFTASREYTWDGGCVVWYETPGNPDSRELFQQMPDGFVACVGTLFYRGRHGAPALTRLWSDFCDPGSLATDALFGNYVVAIGKNARVWLFNDPVGMVRLFQATEAGIVSTSWLACVAASGRPGLDRLGAVDYVLSGSNHGTRTPATGIEATDPTLALELRSDTRVPISRPADWIEAPPFASIDAAVDDCAAILRDRASVIGTAFAGRIRGALSGGFDSRLVLAALQAAGHDARLHVYGDQGDEDVGIARRIADALSLDLVHVDKARVNRGLPPLSAATLEQQCAFFDGIPTDGVLDRGADRQTRLAQSAHGAIALNGGGGEILRNFFYLRDAPFATSSVVDAFYSGYEAGALRTPDEKHAYRAYLEQSINRQVGGGSGRLTRQQVELVYPLFRVRFWTSRNNGIAVRCGHFLTPLVDPMLVRKAAALPLAWKNYGRFESRLIARLSPALAGFPTTYGFAPARGPDPAYRTKMWIQHHRPVFLRANSARIKRVLGRLPVPAVDPELRALFSGPLAIDGLLDLERLADQGQLRRALTLEYLIRSRRLSA